MPKTAEMDALVTLLKIKDLSPELKIMITAMQAMQEELQKLREHLKEHQQDHAIHHHQTHLHAGSVG